MITYSLIFGLAAWALAGIAIAAKHTRGCGVLMWGSFLCASVSVVWQFFEIQKRVSAGDYAGIEDTILAVIVGVILVLGVTLVLNFLALVKRKKETKTA